jgi:hypothetical protein
MNLFRRLLGEQDPQRQEAAPSMHDLVVKEIRFLIDSVVGKSNVKDREVIVFAANQDAMQWFRIRPRAYGASGSAYGVAEITGQPTEAGVTWPMWVKWIPIGQLDPMGVDLWRLAQDRRPLGGHQMHEENRRRAVCEFAGYVLSTLFKAEKKAR